MFRTAECFSLVLIILIIGSCSAFVFRNPCSTDNSTVYLKCGNAISPQGMNSADMKNLIQECVANGLNKQGGKENV